MCAHVFGQVVVTHENSGAESAAKLLGTSVCLQVALQFIGARESLAAEEPVADKWPVSTMPAQVSLQVGGLGVGFATSRDVAVVHVLGPAVLSALPHLLGLDAVRAPAQSLPCAPRG